MSGLPVRTSFAGWMKRVPSSVEETHPSGSCSGPGDTRPQQIWLQSMNVSLIIIKSWVIVQLGLSSHTFLFFVITLWSFWIVFGDDYFSCFYYIDISCINFSLFALSCSIFLYLSILWEKIEYHLLLLAYRQIIHCYILPC